MKWTSWIIKTILPILILSLSIIGGRIIIKNRTKPKKKSFTPPALAVEVMKVRLQSYPVFIHSYGTVSPRTESTLVVEVPGKILRISPNFRKGAFFEKGQTLIEIDPRDYQASIQIAQAILIQKQLVLEEEIAKASQALRDWNRLGNRGAPNKLVLREPQLNAAKATISSEKIKINQIRRDLERTKIKAPYIGRILTKKVDVGQYVSSGTVLAEIYAVDYVEIRLPLNNHQLDFINVPEQFRGDKTPSSTIQVTITATVGRKKHNWIGSIVRTEGSIDTNTRQLYVVAQVDDPYSKKSAHKPPLKIGQFVEAKIEGHRLQNVFVLPRSVVYHGNEVMVVENNQLVRRQVSVLWSTSKKAIIDQGLSAGETISLTPVGNAITGTRVKIVHFAD